VIFLNFIVAQPFKVASEACLPVRPAGGQRASKAKALRYATHHPWGDFKTK